MKLSILKENLHKALGVVNRTLPMKPQLPILNNILFKTEDGQLKIIGTNLETAVILTVGAKIEEEGEITVPGKLLTEFVASLPSEKIDFNLDKDMLRVRTAKVQASFNTISAKEFPPIPSFSKKADIQFSTEQIANSISKTAFSASIDEGRPVLTGIKVRISGGMLSFFATDGYRLSLVHEKLKNNTEEMQLIFPARTLVEVVRIAQEEKEDMIGLTFLKDKNQAIFSTKSTQVVSRLIDGEFPNVEKIVPTSFKTKVTLDKESFFQNVKIASLFARGASNIIKMKIAKDGVHIIANTPQVGENQNFLEAKVEGEEIEIAFNYRFLLDFLNNISFKEVVFESSGSLNPGVFKSAGDSGSFLHIIMPVRLQG